MTSTMDTPLHFRTRYDIAIFWLLGLGAVAAAWGWVSLAPLVQGLAFPAQFYWFLVLAWVVCLAWVGLVFRGRIVLDGGGLRFQSLVRRDEIPWGDVEEVAAAGGFLEFPSLVLKLRRPERFFSLCGVNPCAFHIGLHWKDRERLVSEVLARVPRDCRCRIPDCRFPPQAGSGRLPSPNGQLAIGDRQSDPGSQGLPIEEARAWLEASRRVAWRHRVAPLAGSLCSAALLGYAFVEALAWDPASFIPGLAAVAASALCLALAGGAIDNEWRWKSWLVRAIGLWALVVPAASGSAIFAGSASALVLVLAAGLGWAAATSALCLPIRPRGGQAAVAYAAAMAAALVPAWWYGVREPVPYRAIGPLTPGPWQIGWSPDGRLLYGVGNPASDRERPVCHVLDAASLRVATFPLGEFSSCWLHPADAPVVLYRATGAKKPRELWALDSRTGASKLLHAAPWLSVASEGFLSPDRREAVFLAGAGARRELFVVRLTDLSVRRLESNVDVSRFAIVFWGGDGKLVLAENPSGADGLQRLALWALAPGGNELACLHRAAASELRCTVSPDVRWALVASAADPRTLERWELVDLRSGRSRALPAPLPSPAHFWHMWSPDGTAFAYPAKGAGNEAVVVVDAATGAATEVHRSRERNIAFVALSRGGRYVACAINRGLAAQARIVDTRTGRVIALNCIAALQPLVGFAWAPDRPTLAVATFGGPLGNDRPTAIRFYELPP